MPEASRTFRVAEVGSREKARPLRMPRKIGLRHFFLPNHRIR